MPEKKTLMCIQCGMRAVLNNEPIPMFDQEPEEHRAQYHADPVAVAKEREELERLLFEKLKR